MNARKSRMWRILGIDIFLLAFLLRFSLVNSLNRTSEASLQWEL